MIFAIEAIVACMVFTIIIMSGMRNPLNEIYSYPPNIISRVIELGLIEDKKAPNKLEVIKKKWPVIIVFGVLIGLFVYFVNDADSFVKAFGISYGIWTIVDWYDAIVLDVMWFCHSKRVRIPGTEDMVSDYQDYWFHIRASMIGMLLGLPACLIAGLVCQILP